MNKKLLLFDLDGVIIDSRKNMMQAWSDVCRTFDLSIEFERYFEHIGRPFKDIMSILGLSELAGEIARIYSDSSSSHIDLITTYPGMEETLQILAENGIKMGIVTSKHAERTMAIISRLPVKFVTVQTPNGKLRGKPAPDYLLVAIAEANQDPIECCYIGDMEVDLEAATRAGIDYGHAIWGYGKLSEKKGLILKDSSALLQLAGL